MPEMTYSQVVAGVLEGPFGVALAALWGALWGSFFNVVICRVPEGESLVRPPSHCRVCGAPVRWYDNVPIISYLLLRGRCRHCGARYSARYLLVELLVSALAVLMHLVFIRWGAGDIGLRAAQLAISSLFAGLLVAISFIDLDTFRIPNAITYPGIPVAMGLSVFMGHAHLWDGLVGGVAGYLVIRLIADGYELLTKRQGMGYGDAKLLALTAGLLGWQSIFPTLLLASLQGSAIGITVLVVMRRRHAPPSSDGARGTESDGEPVSDANDESPDDVADAVEDTPLRYAQIPFGPFLCLGAIEVIVLHDVLSSLFPFLFMAI